MNKTNEIPQLSVNAIYKECLERNLAYLKEQKNKIEQGMANIEDDLKRLEQ